MLVMKFLKFSIVVFISLLFFIPAFPTYSATKFNLSAEAGSYSSADLVVDKPRKPVKVKIVPLQGSGFSFYIIAQDDVVSWQSGNEVIAYVGTKNITGTTVLEGRLGYTTLYALVLDNRMTGEFAEIEVMFYTEVPAPFLSFILGIIPLAMLTYRKRKNKVKSK